MPEQIPFSRLHVIFIYEMKLQCYCLFGKLFKPLSMHNILLSKLIFSETRPKSQINPCHRCEKFNVNV